MRKGDSYRGRELFGVPARTLGPAMDPMAEPRPTIEELKALRVVDLRQKLSSLGLPQSGEKLENVFLKPKL